MYAKRIIPCLDLKNGRVVKGTNFVNLRDAGDPVAAAVEYDRQGADERVLLDITASSDARGIMLDIVSHVANSIFIPFTVGGGIRTVEDVAFEAVIGRMDGTGEQETEKQKEKAFHLQRSFGFVDKSSENP